MKIVFLFLFIPITFCCNGMENTYTGSTPAANEVRSFLGIPLSDSVDFIRWWVTVADRTYHLKSNYGIGKPNTPGFWNGGKWIELNGRVAVNGKYYSFQNGNRTLKVLEVNPGFLCLLDESKNLLIGTWAFSYVINNKKMPSNDQVRIISKQGPLNDSMAYQGRTLCNDFSINRPGPNCY